jgi:hypothetical protein
VVVKDIWKIKLTIHVLELLEWKQKIKYKTFSKGVGNPIYLQAILLSQLHALQVPNSLKSFLLECLHTNVHQWPASFSVTCQGAALFSTINTANSNSTIHLTEVGALPHLPPIYSFQQCWLIMKAAKHLMGEQKEESSFQSSVVPGLPSMCGNAVGCICWIYNLTNGELVKWHSTQLGLIDF